MGRRARKTGPGEEGWAAGKKTKKKGRAEILGRKRNFFVLFFSKPNKQFQFNFKLKEFEFKLNHKQ